MDEGSLVEVRVMARAIRRYEEHAAAATGCQIVVLLFYGKRGWIGVGPRLSPVPPMPPNLDNPRVRIPGRKIQASNLQDPERFVSAVPRPRVAIDLRNLIRAENNRW